MKSMLTQLSTTKLTPRFVKNIPETVDDGVIYISMEYATAIHKCCCGCGGEVVTPFSPSDWELTFDGKTVSLYPSIGNWSFPCQSHYWVVKNGIRRDYKWTKQQIENCRNRESEGEGKFQKKKWWKWW